MTTEEIFQRWVALQESTFQEHVSAPFFPSVPVSVPAKTVVSTGVSAQSSAGSSGETKSKTLARRTRVEKTTGSTKRAKGAPITLTAGAGENTLSQDQKNPESN